MIGVKEDKDALELQDNEEAMSNLSVQYGNDSIYRSVLSGLAHNERFVSTF